MVGKKILLLIDQVIAMSEKVGLPIWERGRIVTVLWEGSSPFLYTSGSRQGSEYSIIISD